MKVSGAPRFFLRLFADLAVIIAVCVIFAASATKAGVSPDNAGENPTQFAAKP